MKKKILVFFICITVCLVGFIFYNSIQAREVSAEESEGILDHIINILNIDGGKINRKEMHGVLRKVAHGIEYTALGVSLAILFRQIEKIRMRKYICFPMLVGLCVGVADEFIQSFNGRSSEVRDILIDFGGIVTGVAMVMLVFVVLDATKKAKVKEEKL